MATKQVCWSHQKHFPGTPNKPGVQRHCVPSCVTEHKSFGRWILAAISIRIFAWSNNPHISMAGPALLCFCLSGQLQCFPSDLVAKKRLLSVVFKLLIKTMLPLWATFVILTFVCAVLILSTTFRMTALKWLRMRLCSEGQRLAKTLGIYRQKLY